MMLVKKSALIIPLAIISSNAQALGLGELTVYSRLNQPLKAHIHLTDQGDLRLKDVSVQNADKSYYRKQNLPMPKAFKQVRFQLKNISDKTAVIELTSKKVIREPFITFIADIQWRQGRITKEYTLLLDPPEHIKQAAFQHSATRNKRPQAIVPVKSSQTHSSQRVLKQKNQTHKVKSVVNTPMAGSQNAKRVYTTRPADTLWKIARKVKSDKNITTYQMVQALFAANPEAFIKGDINLLKVDKDLYIPSANEIKTATEPLVKIASLKPGKTQQDAATVKVTEKQTLKQQSDQQTDSNAVVKQLPQNTMQSAEQIAPLTTEEYSPRLTILPPVSSVNSATAEQVHQEEIQTELQTSHDNIQLIDAENKLLEARITALTEQIKQLDRKESQLDKAILAMNSSVTSTAEKIQTLSAPQVQNNAAASFMAPVKIASVLADNKNQRPNAWTENILSSPIMGWILGLFSLLFIFFSMLSLRKRKTKHKDPSAELHNITQTAEENINNGLDIDSEDMNFLEYYEKHINSQEKKPAEQSIHVKQNLPFGHAIEITDTLQSGFHAQNYQKKIKETSSPTKEAEEVLQLDLPEFKEPIDYSHTTTADDDKELLNEIDTYLIYGSYDQAEKILTEKLAGNSVNTLFILKLFECYALADKPVEFSRLVERSLNKLQAEQSFKDQVEQLYQKTWDKPLQYEPIVDKDSCYAQQQIAAR